MKPAPGSDNVAAQRGDDAEPIGAIESTGILVALGQEAEVCLAAEGYQAWLVDHDCRVVLTRRTVVFSCPRPGLETEPIAVVRAKL